MYSHRMLQIIKTERQIFNFNTDKNFKKNDKTIIFSDKLFYITTWANFDLQ